MSRIEESTLRKFLATAAVAFALSSEAGASLAVVSADARNVAGSVAKAEQGVAVVRRTPALRAIK